MSVTVNAGDRLGTNALCKRRESLCLYFLGAESVLSEDKKLKCLRWGQCCRNKTQLIFLCCKNLIHVAVIHFLHFLNVFSHTRLSSYEGTTMTLYKLYLLGNHCENPLNLQKLSPSHKCILLINLQISSFTLLSLGINFTLVIQCVKRIKQVAENKNSTKLCRHE